MKSVVSIMKALGESHRLKAFLALLHTGELCVCELAELLALSTATTSRHMSILSSTGLIKAQKRGKWVYYSISQETDPLLLQWITDKTPTVLSIEQEKKGIREKLTCCGSSGGREYDRKEEFTVNDIRNYVRERYAKAITNSTSCCSTPGCCTGAGTADILSMTRGNYDQTLLEKTPEQMTDQSFGCGNPIAEADLQPGEIVLDLGSGAGLDLFLASEAVGALGKVIGLDMTDEMLSTAAKNLKGLENITLVKGYIEEMPLEDNSVDVVISNCVINLSPDKGRVLKEAFRVLRPGGRFCVSDTVFLRPVAEKAVKNLAAWSGCISGALQEVEYMNAMNEAGFEKVEIRRGKVYSFPDALAAMAFPELSAAERIEINGVLASAIIVGKKPVS